jgi:hypothetical protein
MWPTACHWVNAYMKGSCSLEALHCTISVVDLWLQPTTTSPLHSLFQKEEKQNTFSAHQNKDFKMRMAAITQEEADHALALLLANQEEYEYDDYYSQYANFDNERQSEDKKTRRRESGKRKRSFRDDDEWDPDMKKKMPHPGQPAARRGNVAAAIH